MTQAPTAPLSTGVSGLPEPVRRRRRPVLVIAAVVIGVVVAAIVMALLSAASASTQVWSTAGPVSRGQSIREVDLVAVEVPADAAQTLITASLASRDQLTDGSVWVADLPAGQLLVESLAVEQLPVPTGQALVGVRLDPGGFPTAGLRPGDAVQVVASTGQQGGEAQVLVDRGVVEAIAVLADDTPAAPRLVTIQVPDDRAAAVAAAGLDGNVSLVVVP